MFVGLLTWAALWITPGLPTRIFICFLVSGLYAQAAADAREEDPERREIVNLNRIASHFIGLVFPGAILFLLALPVLATWGWLVNDDRQVTAAVLAALILAGGTSLVFRMWPAYVTPWLYRGEDQLDLWRDRSNYNPMVTDWPLAWELTAQGGARMKASLPVVSALGIVFGSWVLLMNLSVEQQIARIALTAILLFLLVPALDLVFLERASALRDARMVQLGLQQAMENQATAPVEAPSETTPEDTSELEAAIYAGDTENARRFLEEPPRRVDENHLSLAAGLGHTNIVKLLLDEGLAPDGVDVRGEQPVHAAARGGHIGTLEMLLASGAKINVANKEGDSPLDTVIKSAHCDYVDKTRTANWMLDRGARGTENTRWAARANGLDEIVTRLPVATDEPPLDPDARGIHEVRLYEDGRNRVSYLPNDIRHPFEVAEWEQRDGWVAQRYGSDRFGELRSRLVEFELAWATPLVDSWQQARPWRLRELLGRYRDQYDEEPVIIYFQT